MKTFLNYLNWTSYYTNQLFIYVIKFYLKIGIALFVMLAVSVPVLYFDSVEAIAIWGAALFFGSLFITISWIIKHEQPESMENVNRYETETKTKTWKMSYITSFKWVLYTFFVFTIAAIVSSFL